MTKLVIHVDLRNTILVADTFTNTTVEAALASYLSSVSWGRVRDGRWEMERAEISLNKPSEQVISYYTFVEGNHRAGDRRQVRELTGKFVASEAGGSLGELYEGLIARLRWQPKEGSSQFCIGGEYHFLLPSFFFMVKQLMLEEVDFSIIIRTFGMDCPNALGCIGHFLQNKHPLYRIERVVPINTDPFYIRRGSHPNSIALLNSRGEVVCGDTEQFHQWTRSAVGILGIVDEYSSWEANDYSFRWGKPFFVGDDDSTVQIIFDDNARPREENSIVNLIRRDPSRGTYRSLTAEEGAPYFGTNVIQVDLVEAITDESYFKNKLSLK